MLQSHFMQVSMIELKYWRMIASNGGEKCKRHVDAEVNYAPKRPIPKVRTENCVKVHQEISIITVGV